MERRHRRYGDGLTELNFELFTGTWAAGNGKPSNGASHVRVQIQVAGEPAPGWLVELHAAGPGGSHHLDTAVSNGDGDFRLRAGPWARHGVFYLIAKQGAENRMLTTLGTARDAPEWVVVNELSTAASIWTSAQFLDGESIQGNAVGLKAAARNVPNLVDLETGQLGAVVQNVSNGSRTTTLATLNTLASLLADCLVGGCAGRS